MKTATFRMLMALAAAASAGCKSETPLEPEKKAAVAQPSAPTEAAPTPDATTTAEEDASAPVKKDEVDVEARLAPPADVAAPPNDAERHARGIASKRLREGASEPPPGPEDTVIVQYTAWTNDGQVKDSTWKRGEPRTIKLGKTMRGWADALQLMAPGERRLLWVPAKDALKGSPKGTLVIDMELLTVHRAPKAPDDVARPPKDARRTGSGLAFKELVPGTGTEHPKLTSTVMVRYAGWTTDGKSFDSTHGDETASFRLDGVIPGWTEGLALMVKGQKARMWIPEKHAYAGKAGKPKGMLVFDVELVDFE
jgi:peptidylprolyl isomerase